MSPDKCSSNCTESNEQRCRHRSLCSQRRRRAVVVEFGETRLSTAVAVIDNVKRVQNLADGDPTDDDVKCQSHAKVALGRMFIKCLPTSLASRKIPTSSPRLPMARLHVDRQHAQRPRLPVPRLHDTLQKYLASVEPFLLEDEAKGGDPFHQAMQKRVAWAEEFEGGVGSTLQERLTGASYNLVMSYPCHDPRCIQILTSPPRTTG